MDTHVLLTRTPLYSGLLPFSFDLHVLSAPPTLILSRDQTLNLIVSLFAMSGNLMACPCLAELKVRRNCFASNQIVKHLYDHTGILRIRLTAASKLVLRTHAGSLRRIAINCFRKRQFSIHVPLWGQNNSEGDCRASRSGLPLLQYCYNLLLVRAAICECSKLSMSFASAQCLF